MLENLHMTQDFIVEPIRSTLEFHDFLVVLEYEMRRNDVVTDSMFDLIYELKRVRETGLYVQWTRERLAPYRIEQHDPKVRKMMEELEHDLRGDALHAEKVVAECFLRPAETVGQVKGSFDFHKRFFDLGLRVDMRSTFTPDLRAEADELLRFVNTDELWESLPETMEAVKPWNDPRFTPEGLAAAAKKEKAEFQSLLRICDSPGEIATWRKEWHPWLAAERAQVIADCDAEDALCAALDESAKSSS